MPLNRMCAPGIIKASAAVVPTLTQLGTDFTTANSSAASDFSFTSVTGDLLFAVGIRNNSSSTTMPDATWNGVACTLQSGIRIAGAGNGGAAIWTIKGGATGARTFTITPPGNSISRLAVAAYDITSWDGTADQYTALEDAPTDVDVAITLASIAASARVIAVGAFPLGNAAPLSWTNATELDEIVQGTTTGVAASVAYRVTSGAESSVTLTCTGDTAVAESAIAAMALRNA